MNELIENNGAANEHDAIYEALWGVIGDLWFDGRRRCVIEERGGSQGLLIQQMAPYSLRVNYVGAEAADTAWSVELTREDANGWGGYEVCAVTSETGHSIDALKNCLLGACQAMSENKAARYLEQ
jgi:hypothetical protein